MSWTMPLDNAGKRYIIEFESVSSSVLSSSEEDITYSPPFNDYIILCFVYLLLLITLLGVAYACTQTLPFFFLHSAL